MRLHAGMHGRSGRASCRSSGLAASQPWGSTLRCPRQPSVSQHARHCPASHHTSPQLRPSSSRVQAVDPERSVDMQRLSNLISIEPLETETRFTLEQLAAALDVPLGTVKNMAFKRKGILALGPDDVKAAIAQLADIVQVTPAQAREMVVIQPGLLLDTAKQAETLRSGIQAICYELEAPKEEVVELILKNQSVLHGRELRLSVADMAHLAMLREPRGRIVD